MRTPEHAPTGWHETEIESHDSTEVLRVGNIEVELESNEEGELMISVDDLHRILSREDWQKYVDVIDVRSQDEFRDEHIEGVRNEPLTVSAASMEELEEAARKIHQDKFTLYICKSGKRSGDAAAAVPDFVEGAELCQIVSVAGGLAAWKEKQYEVVKETLH